jgi:type II secretory pathway component GspD/PulD (secretin)
MRASWKFALAVVASVSGMGTSPARDGDDDRIAVEARDGPLELEKLVALVADVTGEPFFVDPAALHGLRARPIETKAIPRKRLLSYLDDQLREFDFVHVERIVAGVRCHSVTALGRSGGHRSASLKTDAEVVTPDELASIADRSKLVTTALTFRSRGLAEGMQHTLCYRHADSASEAIRLVQETGIFVMTGAASNVAQEVALIRRLDASGIRSEFDAREEARCEALAARVTALEAALAGH